MEYLSFYRYLMGAGGGLLILVIVFGWSLYAFLKEFNPNHPLYDGLANIYIGLTMGLAMIFVTLPLLCYIRTIPLCFRIM